MGSNRSDSQDYREKRIVISRFLALYIFKMAMNSMDCPKYFLSGTDSMNKKTKCVHLFLKFHGLGLQKQLYCTKNIHNFVTNVYTKNVLYNKSYFIIVIGKVPYFLKSGIILLS